MSSLNGYDSYNKSLSGLNDINASNVECGDISISNNSISGISDISVVNLDAVNIVADNITADTQTFNQQETNILIVNDEAYFNGIITQLSNQLCNLSNISCQSLVCSGNFEGTLATGAQPNITSIGTLSGLTVSGNSNLNNISGTLTTASQPNVTSIGTLSGLTVSGNSNLNNISGTLTTASQPNVTSIGTLSGLTVSGNSNLYDNAIIQTVNFPTSYPTLKLIGSSTKYGSINFYDNASVLKSFIYSNSLLNALLIDVQNLTNGFNVNANGNPMISIDPSGNCVINAYCDIGSVYKIGGTQVLSNTSLGSSIVSSSLQSLGTLSSLTVSGDVTIDSNTLKVDSVNNRVGIVKSSPAYTLDITGDCNISGSYRVGGTTFYNGSVCTVPSVVNSPRLTSTGDLRVYSNSGYTLYLNNDKTSGDVYFNTGSPSSNIYLSNGGIVFLTTNQIVMNGSNISNAGSITKTKYNVGEVIYSRVYLYGQYTQGTYTINSASLTTILSFDYNPLQDKSNINAYIYANYNITGFATDSFRCSLWFQILNSGGTVVGGSTKLFQMTQSFNGGGTGGGTRSGTCFPLFGTALYTTFNNNWKTNNYKVRFIVIGERLSGDDSLLVNNNASDFNNTDIRIKLEEIGAS